MRIISIIENLDKGAVENWLINCFIESKKTRPDWEWTFYCILGRPGVLDDKVKEHGGIIMYSPCTISDKFRFLRSLRKTLKFGQYDILHSHHDYLSGFYLIATHGLKFKKRILHIHNTDKALPVGNRIFEKVLLPPLRWLGIHYSDIIVGISKHTLAKFIGKSPVHTKRIIVLYYGIDLARFEIENGQEAFRSDLNLPSDARLLIFSGRMNYLKNPVFVLEVLKELNHKDHNFYALFAGEGELLSEVEATAIQLNILDHIRLLGWRTDLSKIMLNADIFIFPRLEEPKEGLGLVVVEAQAAGLPMILSNGIVPDAIEISELAEFIPLRNNAVEWADKILGMTRKLSKAQALDRMINSKFALPKATENLIKLYEN